MSNKPLVRARVARLTCFLLLFAGTLCVAVAHAEEPSAASRKVVILAGTVHQGPGGHPPGTHEYELSARLLKRALDESGLPVRTEIHFDGWPREPQTLDDADTIVVISDGADRNLTDHPLLLGDRLQVIGKQMDRGCGLVAIHWTTFVPNDRGGPEFLEWIGGYFDYQSGTGGHPWYSKIQTVATRPQPASPQHPICRGLTAFDLREEYYYNIRFRERDTRLVPILTTTIPGEAQPQVVAWAVERDGGGRGFGFTGGHFFENWGEPNFRRMVLNALLWTAHVEVPAAGVASNVFPPKDPPVAASDQPIQAVIVTGHQHPGHLWRETTPALQEALLQDKRLQVTVVTDPEFLATDNLHGYDVVVLNYCNWQRPGLSEEAKANFQKYLAEGGGLALIHFANGAFHASLPETPASDWPEYRNICRRVWDHTPGTSGHDVYGRFRVDVVKDHPITAGLNSFETIDELYFNQQGDGEIEVLATARSTVTGRDEPMAFVYPYGKGRVFQTVLGHAAESIRTPGTATLIRRGVVWAAGQPQRAIASQPAEQSFKTPKLTPEGKFASALDPRGGAAAWAEHHAVYDARPLTVECWAKLDSESGFNILVAHTSKESGDHWELYTYAGSGELSLYLPGCEPAEIKSGRNVVDGAWHYLAAAFDDTQVKLFVDGHVVHQAAIARVRRGGPITPLHFGGYPPHNIGCAGLVDEVRISNVLRPIEQVPEGPFVSDEATIGLWHFDQLADNRVEDASSRRNAAQAGSQTPVVSPMLTRRPSDPKLRLATVDTSPDESFLSLRLDTAGRLFAGGREALFAYEPDGAGGFGPRQLLYRFPPDTWITDIEIRGDDLYVMTNAALYRFIGGRVRREHLVPERLLWGSPVDLHVTWHGLAWGPEGDLYFSSGDPLLNYGDFQKRPDHFGHWTIYGPNGQQTHYTGVGGFYRCRPDGTGLRVVAGGTRGAVGLAFDRRWHLFSNDNDHESIADRYSPARLLHVAPQANFFWPRGWIASMSPDRYDLLETVNTGMGRDVPVGQGYLDEPSLGEEYTDSLLLARWGQRRVSGYRLEPRGASFTGAEYPLLIGEELARPVGVAVGGGRVFIALSYMAGNEWSPKYPSEIVVLSSAARSVDHAAMAYDAPTATAERLWAELGSDSSQRRQQAHQEILRRGGDLLNEAVTRLRPIRDDHPAAAHLVWLAAASQTPQARDVLQHIARSATPALRAAAVRALAEYPALDAEPGVFAAALNDDDAQVKHAGVAAQFDRDEPILIDSLRSAACATDSYLRQTATLLIEGLLNSSNPASRLAGVLAAGFRLTVPPAIGELPAELPLKYESGNAEFVIQYADAKIDLKSLGRVGSFTVAERWKAIPPTDEERKLYDLLVSRLRDNDERIYRQASYFLNLIDDGPANELIARQDRERLLARVNAGPVTQVIEVWTIGPFDDQSGFDSMHAPEQGPIDLSATIDAGGRSLSWERVPLDSITAAAKLEKPGSRYVYFRLQSRAQQPARLSVSSPGKFKLWHNGRAIEVADPLLLSLAAGSNDLLVRFEDAANGTLAIAAHAPERVDAVLPEKLGLATLAERLREAGQSDGATIAPEFLAVDWNTARAQGDVERGRKLFGADALGCVKCHAVLENQPGGGAPSLAGAAKRFTVGHLVESILAPSKQVAPVFGTTTVVTADGQSMSGLVVEESEHSLTLLLPTAVRQEIAKSDIEARRLHSASPMPSGLVKTPAELADLLAYLLSENPPAP
jgi:putative heme-binding domain-containing protein